MEWNVLDGFDSAPPMILLSRYRDNIYFALANMPVDLRPSVRFGISDLLRFVYNIPLKWEPHGVAVAWGEGVVIPRAMESRIGLLRKGASQDLHDPTARAEAKWNRWVSPASPNARLIWHSLLLAIISKSIWFAWNAADVMVNVRSLVWGLSIKGYPLGWWKPSFLCLFDTYMLCRFFTQVDIMG